MNVTLCPPFSFSVFPHREKLRLVVFNNNEEYVCRIENRKKLNQFIETEDSSIFSGRLQLIKNQEEVFVQVKGVIIGKMPKTVFKQILN